MYRGYPRQGEAYPLHVKNFISQVRDAERRRAAMTPNLQVNPNLSYNVVSTTIPNSTTIGWTTHVMPPTDNTQEYKPFIPMYNVSQSGPSTYMMDNQQPTAVPTHIRYSYPDPVLSNHQQPEVQSSYNMNSGQAPVYSVNFIPGPQDAAQPNPFIIPNTRDNPDSIANRARAAYNPQGVLIGSFTIRVPQNFDDIMEFQENMRRQQHRYANSTETQSTSAQYDYARTDPQNPERAIVVHSNGLVRYENKTVGLIDPEVLRVTNNFIFDSETMADHEENNPQVSAEEQRYQPSTSYSEDNVQDRGPSLIRARCEESDVPEYAEDERLAKRPRLDAGSSARNEAQPQPIPFHHNQVITVEDDDDEYDTQPNYATYTDHRSTNNDTEESDNEDSDDSSSCSSSSGSRSSSTSSPSSSAGVDHPSVPSRANVYSPVSAASSPAPVEVAYSPVSLASPPSPIRVVYSPVSPASSVGSPSEVYPPTSAASSSATSAERRPFNPNVHYGIPANMHFLFDSERFRKLYILYKLSAVKTVDDHDVGEKCVICLIDFERGQTILQLRCEHKFHDNCIYMWCAAATTCPMCRREIVDEAICHNFPNRLLQNLEFIRYLLVRRRCLGESGGLSAISENDEVDAPGVPTSRAGLPEIHVID